MQPRATGPGIGTGTPLQVLWRDCDRVFCRASRDEAGEGRATALVVVPAAEHPTRRCLDRLEHEYSLKDDLDAAWAVRPLDLIHERGRTWLVLDDPGAEPLSGLLGAPMETLRFLRLAEATAAALRGLHARGLVHKDINPANLLVDEASGHAWLTGFGIASRLPRERQTPSPPESLAGTLAYMAPEQTGRMNRSVDSRSDLYSLGVTFYEMLTGAPPFAASDPMEWVHCHIARQPTAPLDRLAVPPPLSDIVMRLLAKNAEERYQTAAGLEADLRRCLSQWRSDGRIVPFPLGADDLSDRLLVPEKLYGREREVAALLAAFDRVATQGATELVLVSGYSGVGKSSVVNELHKALVPPRGLFAAGKFDQYKRDVPYATVAQAFQMLVRQILAKSEAELQAWRMALGEALGANGRLIVDLIPELELIVGQQPPVADLPPQDAQRRFHAVLRRFIGVFAAPEHPLALFLDDLQWLDAATLDLLEDLLTQGGVQHLLLIGAYRDNEVGAEHPLTRRLDAIRRTDAAVRDIVLAPLSYRDLEQLIGETLHSEAEHTAPLVRIVDEKTGGNPFFAIQFLHALADEALLAFDHAEARWTWDADRINGKGYTDNVVDLMVGKLGRLPAETQGTLRQLASVGAGAEFALLTTVCQVSLEALHGRLWEAVRAGLVVRSQFSYAFQHDRILEAAYSLIPEAVRAQAHLRIGRLLREHTPPDRCEEMVFEMVGHFNRSAALITAPDECEAVARLNLAAGKRAGNAAAYSSALTYLNAGRALLAEDCWTRQHSLAFELELQSAECELLTGETARADERLSRLTGRATNIIDQAAVTCLHIDVCTVLPEMERAVELCRGYLRDAGVHWPTRLTDEDVRRACEGVRRRIGSREIEDLIDLPTMSDPGVRATMDVLCRATPSAEAVNDKLICLLIAQMVSLSLDHGNSDASCCGYTWFGAVLGPILEDYAASIRFGQLGLALADKQEFDAFRCRVYFSFGLSVSSWAQHLKFGRQFILRSGEEANKGGDLPYLDYSHIYRVASSLALGIPLVDVEKEILDAVEFARRDARIPFTSLSHLCLVRLLQGIPFEFTADDGEIFDEERLRQRMEADPNQKTASHSYWIGKIQSSVFAEDYPAAIEATAKAHDLRWIARADFGQADYQFYAALVRARSAEAAPSDYPIHLEALAVHHEQLQTWARHCPENFENRAALIGAEIARLKGRDVEAQRLYQQAISSARANGFIHNEALACETAARFYAGRGFEDIAEMYLVKARDGYRRWGADGVVRRLEASHPWLAAADPRDRDDETPPPNQQLDVATVVKASQALSSEILLPRLIERLMTIALQNAGADRGLLILPHEGDYRIEAAARADGEAVAVQVGVLDDPATPESLIRYAMRTQETVILDDATKPHLFSSDADLALRRPRSVLCLPLVRQGALSGLIYLENTLAPHVFTPERARLLELLASQAAISLENARFYADLELQVGLLQQLPVSAWTLRPDGTPDFVNRVWLDFSGQTPEFIESHPEAWMAAVHPEDRETAAKSFWEGVRSGQDFAFESRSLRARDGIYRQHLQQAVVIRDAEGQVLKFVGATTDIDDLKRAEMTLRRAQSDLARSATSLVEGQRLTKSGSYVLLLEEDELVLSQELRLIFGYEPGEAATLPDIWERMLPEYRVPLGEQLQSAFEGNPTASLFQMRMPDGEIKHLRSATAGARMRDGRLEMIGSVQDITESKLAEAALTRARSELAHVARVATLNAMTASIAHEVAQPLSGILTNANTALRMLAADPPNVAGAVETAQRTVRDANRASAVLTRLRAMVSKHEPVTERVDLNTVARDAIAISTSELQQRGAYLNTEFADNLPDVRADRVQLQQVILNLMLNAADAMEHIEDRPRSLLVKTQLETGGGVRLEVCDVGTGFDPGAAEKLFEAFYTTKANGMGIGLSICRSIIESHEGRLWATPNDGPGATFGFSIPVASEPEGGRSARRPRRGRLAHRRAL